MPRKTRMYLTDIPVHVLQRGNKRGACFFREDEVLKICWAFSML